MRRNLVYLSLSILLFSTMLFSIRTSINADQGNKHEPTIEKQDKKKSTVQPHPNFSWDILGASSPVLHPGSAKGAGMIEDSLFGIDSVMEKATILEL